jgi:hypothetical protein
VSMQRVVSVMNKSTMHVPLQWRITIGGKEAAASGPQFWSEKIGPQI